jgi:hypothetical protein
MSRKQPNTPNQLSTLEEIKRKARASQEARLQRALDRLSRQEQEPIPSSIPGPGISHSLDPRRTTVKYYAVRRGRTCNAIYISWALCKNQVLNYPEAEFKAFTTYEAAQDYLNSAQSPTEGRVANNRAVGSTYQAPPTTADSTTQTAAYWNITLYLEGVALGILIGALITLWTLLHQ